MAAASMVCSIWLSLCARPTNNASYCDGGEVDAVVEHGVEERGVGGGVAGGGVGEVGDGLRRPA